jgi:hypothetical protein
MKKIVLSLFPALLFGAAMAVPAIAQQIDLQTALSPSYLNPANQFVAGVSPYYSQSVTPTTLQMVGSPNLPNDVGTHNFTAIPLVTGDFSAVITASVGLNAGGAFNAVFDNGGYAGEALNKNQVWVNFGLGNGNVTTNFTNYGGNSVVFDLSRSGSNFNVYASFGGPYVNLITLAGSSVSGPAGLDLFGFGNPGVPAPTTTTYKNLYVTQSAGGSISGLTGGTASNPIVLPATTTKSITGDIGGPNEPTSDFYSFYWNGGNFSASVGVPQAAGLLNPPSYSFELCSGASCISPLQQTLANSGNSWESSLSGNLHAGLYTIGITELGTSSDPQFTINFNTPLNQISGVSAVPLPSTWGMMLMGLISLGFIAYRQASKPALMAA